VTTPLFVLHPYSSRSLSLSLSTMKECFDAVWSAREREQIFVINLGRFSEFKIWDWASLLFVMGILLIN
jgi:hypothetical protein